MSDKPVSRENLLIFKKLLAAASKPGCDGRNFDRICYLAIVFAEMLVDEAIKDLPPRG